LRAASSSWNLASSNSDMAWFPLKGWFICTVHQGYAFVKYIIAFEKGGLRGISRLIIQRGNLCWNWKAFGLTKTSKL
jgi:hypothetical protein